MVAETAQITGVSGKNASCQCQAQVLRFPWFQNQGTQEDRKVCGQKPHCRQEPKAY